MKKLTGVIITALLLTGCSQGEPVELKMPYNVETAAQQVTGKLKTEIEVAEAVIATPEPTPEPVAETPTPAPETPSEAILEPLEPISEPEPIPEPEPVVEYVEPAPDPVEVVDPVEELPTPADEFAYYDQTYIGTYTVTWYSREAVGYDAPGASGLGCIPYATCALPDYGLLGCYVYVEGYGTYLCTDISPGGICDLYVLSNADIPGYGMGSADVYVVG